MNISANYHVIPYFQDQGQAYSLDAEMTDSKQKSNKELIPKNDSAGHYQYRYYVENDRSYSTYNARQILVSNEMYHVGVWIDVPKVGPNEPDEDKL